MPATLCWPLTYPENSLNKEVKMQCEVEALGSNKGHLTAWCLLWRWGRVTPSWNTITWYAIVFLHKMPLENNFYKSIL